MGGGGGVAGETSYILKYNHKRTLLFIINT